MRARAVAAVAQVDVIASAARDYDSDFYAFPEDTGLGVVPPGFVEYLPENFSFDGEGYQLDWENMSFPSGFPEIPVRPVCSASESSSSRRTSVKRS